MPSRQLWRHCDGRHDIVLNAFHITDRLRRETIDWLKSWLVAYSRHYHKIYHAWKKTKTLCNNERPEICLLAFMLSPSLFFCITNYYNLIYLIFRKYHTFFFYCRIEYDTNTLYGFCWHNWKIIQGPVYPGPRFTNSFSIAIRIWWKFRFPFISILIQWSLQKFVHGTTSVLSWHVQKICCDLMASNGIPARRIFHRIWIASKTSLVRRSPSAFLHHYSDVPKAS